jgi:hypothetical protein
MEEKKKEKDKEGKKSTHGSCRQLTARCYSIGKESLKQNGLELGTCCTITSV